MDRDQNAAINIKNLAVGMNVSSKAQSRTEAKAGAAEKPRGCHLRFPQMFIRSVQPHSVGIGCG